MKKLLLMKGQRYVHCPGLKLLRIMKLSFFIMFVALLQISANGLGQEAKVSLQVTNSSVSDVFNEIESQTDYRFVYKSDDLHELAAVSVNVEKDKVSTVLRDLLASTSLEYRILDDGLIVITKNIDKQGTKITGTVTDANGSPLPGVNIVEKGTNNGAVTDLDGNYSITVSSEEAVLSFSFVGYLTEEIEVGGQTNVDVTLIEDIQALDEVVVVGYGTQKKVNMTGAVTSVDFESEAISSRPLTNVSSALTGLFPGMVVTQGNGAPSSASDGATIRIRGVGTLNAGSAPLILIDGQPGDINAVNPNDVASVTVLKDAASSAIYGSRASNGVIIVTTKTGSDTHGKLVLNYTGNMGLSEPTKLFDVISNTADHMTLINQIQENSNLSPLFTQEFIDEWRQKSKTDPILYPNTNWWDAIIKPNTIQNHSLSARGGNDKVNFFTSLGYLNNNGIIDHTGYERITFRNNLSYKLNDWLKLGGNLTALFGKANSNDEENILRRFNGLSPGILPKHPDGRYGGAMTGGVEQQAGRNNIIHSIETSIGERNTQRYTGKLFGILSPIAGLEIEGSYSVDMYHYNEWSSQRLSNIWDFQNETVIFDLESDRLGISNYNTKRQRHIYDLFATYQKSYGKHNMKVLTGFNQEYFKEVRFNASKKDLYSVDIPVLDAAPNDPQAGGNAYDFAVRSYFGRLNYDYSGKYLFETNFRYDGSSRFHPDKRWGFFPSFSAGWRVSEEPFWGEIGNFMSYLKLRASWGQLGNSGIGNYEWQSVYEAANYSFDGTIVQGLAPNAIANSNMTWETTDVFNMGADMNIFENFSVSLDYYNKFTHGILANIPIPFVNGGLTAPRINSAEVRNSGIEANIIYNKRIGSFNIAASVNGSYNKNIIENYKGDYLEPHGPGVWTEGQPIGIFWVREVDRIIQEQSEIDQLINDGWTFNPSTPGPGDFLYKNTNDDKVIDDDDRVLKGNPIPVFTYGGTLNISYGGFDFYTLVNGISGWDKYLNDITHWPFFSLQQRAGGYLYLTDFLNSWTPENRSTSIPKIYTNDSKNDQQSDYFLHDASFMRIKSIQLGYTIPSDITQRVNIEKVRIYVNLENYFTFTSFPGMDPEIDVSWKYPIMKTTSFGLNINL